MSFDHRRFLANVSEAPGVYRMLDAQGDTLYVGKARRLKARLASYFRGALNAKTQALVGRIADIQVTVTINIVEIVTIILHVVLTKRLDTAKFHRLPIRV